MIEPCGLNMVWPWFSHDMTMWLDHGVTMCFNHDLIMILTIIWPCFLVMVQSCLSVCLILVHPVWTWLTIVSSWLMMKFEHVVVDELTMVDHVDNHGWSCGQECVFTCCLTMVQLYGWLRWTTIQACLTMIQPCFHHGSTMLNHMISHVHPWLNMNNPMVDHFVWLCWPCSWSCLIIVFHGWPCSWKCG